jgi:hypothetical protein
MENRGPHGTTIDAIDALCATVWRPTSTRLSWDPNNRTAKVDEEEARRRRFG